MKMIPDKLKKDGRQYIKVKEYSSFVLYKDRITGIRECFTFHALGLIKPFEGRLKRILRPEKVKK